MKIYVINLARAHARREAMEKQLEKRGMEVEYIGAVDGSRLSPEEIEVLADIQAIEGRYKRRLSNGEIACAASHRSVYKDMIAHDISRAIVLEDDVVLNQDFLGLIDSLESLILPRCVIKIDSFSAKSTSYTLRHRIPIKGGYEIRKPIFPQWDARGYVIDKEAAQRLLDTYDRVSLLADDWGAMRRQVRIRCLIPGIVDDNDAIPSQLESDRSGKGCPPSKPPNMLIRSVKHMLFLVDKFTRMLFS